ncbi:MAG: hypothetical protein ABSB32_23195 [Thermodesulfobacteriota bacterium]|jgi:hypothetical protein
MVIQIRADETSEIIRNQIRGFERKRVPAVGPFKPLPIRHRRQQPHGQNKQDEHNLIV